MPRRKRLRIAGLPLHIVQRGVNRARCFDGDGDRCLYLSLLEAMCARHACRLHAYVLMANHVHLLMTPDVAGAASVVMKHLGQQYVQAFNRTRSRTGTLWDGRFKSSIVDSDAYLFSCHRYIELNPVRARMAVHPADYAWSSYRANALGQACSLLRPHPLYLSLAPTPAERQYAYQALFGAAALKADDSKSIRDALRSGLPLGRPGFVRQLQEVLEQQTQLGRDGRPKGRKSARSSIRETGV